MDLYFVATSLHAVHVTGEVAAGEIRPVKIVASNSNSLTGELAG